MAKHGLTRIRYEGDKAVVIAGPIPPETAARGFTETLVEDVPVATPMTRVRHIVRPPTIPADAGANPQAEKEKP